MSDYSFKMVPTRKNTGMTNDSKGARESIRLLDTSARRGTIKQWDRGDRTDIKKETDESKGGREERTNKRRALSRPATYVFTFVSRERSTTSKSITSDDNRMAMLRNA